MDRLSKYIEESLGIAEAVASRKTNKYGLPEHPHGVEDIIAFLENSGFSRYRGHISGKMYEVRDMDKKKATSFNITFYDADKDRATHFICRFDPRSGEPKGQTIWYGTTPKNIPTYEEFRDLANEYFGWQ